MRRWIHEYMKGTHQLCCWQPASCSTGLAAKVEMRSCASLRWQAHTLTQQQQHQEQSSRQTDKTGARIRNQRTQSWVLGPGRNQDRDQDQDETDKRAEE